MRINAQVKTLDIDLESLKKGTRKTLYSMFHDGIRAFLEVAAPAVPVDTGMARGSFLNLQQMLRSAGVSVDNVDIPTTPQRTRRDGRPLIYKHYNGREYPKTPQTAKESFSTRADKILTEKNGKVQFTYEASVKHLNFNEYKAQWRAFERGKTAMFSAMNFSRLSILDYLTTSTVSGGRNGPKVRVRNQRTTRS